MRILYVGDDPGRKNAMQHQYVKALLRLQKQGKLKAGVHSVHIYHDNWCRIYDGGYCNCEPEIQIHTA